MGDLELKEKCPKCNGELECVLGEDNFVIDWFCLDCSRYFDLEDMKIKPKQTKLKKWIEK